MGRSSQTESDCEAAGKTLPSTVKSPPSRHPAQHSTSMAPNASFGVPSGGLRDAMTCEVCLEVYDQASRTPLSLPCGHTFCRPCLATLRASTWVQCPNCRKRHKVQVEALPVNYPLLNITPLYGELQSEGCTTHGDNLRYFCCTCGQQLCSLCLHAGHPQDHSVKLTQLLVQEEKARLEEILRGVAADLDDLLAKVQEAKDIVTIKHLEKSVRNFCPAVRVMSPSDDK